MKRALSLTSDPIPQLLWRIALPTSVGMFFNTLFNLVDTLCAGWLSTDALAGLSLTFPVFFGLIAVASGLMQGATALLAHALGAGDIPQARRLFAQSVLLAVLVGLVITVVGYAITPWIFSQLGANGAYLKLGTQFMETIFLGSLFFLLVATLNAPLSAQGDTQTNRNFLIVGFLANCLLNPLLMWGVGFIPALGVSGIALATVLVQIGGCIWLWHKAMKTEALADLPADYFWPDFRSLWQLMAQSLPASLNMATIALGVLVITRFVEFFGKEALAAIGIATRIEQLILMPVIGLSAAVLSLTGQNHGAGHSDRIREAWITSLGYGIGLMLPGGAVLWLLRYPLLKLFTQDPGIIARGGDYLECAAITLAAYPILFGTVFLLQGLKRPVYGLWMGLYRQLAAPLLVFPLLSFTLGWGLWGIWWGIALINWSAALFALGWGWRAVQTLEKASGKEIRSDFAAEPASEAI